jgi:hypothetical protein
MCSEANIKHFEVDNKRRAVEVMIKPGLQTFKGLQSKYLPRQ